jgi:hypothetical protein
MAKEAGFPFQVQLDTEADALTDISNDVTNFNFTTPRAVFDWTGVDKSAMERGLGLADFSATLNGIFNPDLSHDVLATVGTGVLVRDFDLTISGESLDNDVLVTDYAFTRAANGNMTWTAPLVLADGENPAWT